MKITSSLRIGIIGGTGKTGNQFAHLFRGQGFAVEVTGSETCHRNAELLRTCDIVVFSLPLAESALIMEQEMPNARRKDQLLLDLSSLKQPQVTALLRGSGEVIGMHPLFGPRTESTGETIILCPARATDETVRSLEELLQATGLRTKRMTAQEHDRLMAFLQVLPHVKNFLVAEVLEKSGADLPAMLATCSPPYELELNVIGRFLDDSPGLYGPIILNNPDTLVILEALGTALLSCVAMVKQKDLQGFSDRYERLRAYFGSQTAKGRENTEACIRLLSAKKR